MSILPRSRNRQHWIRYGKVFLCLAVCIAALGRFGKMPVHGIEENRAATARAVFEQYCVQCHGASSAKAGINLEQMLGQNSIEKHFQSWEKVARVLEQKTMPPKAMPQPSDAERAESIAWITTEINSYAAKHDGEPGPVTVRRLTSGEYGYAIKDLTGLELNVGIDAATDSVGGEGFTNFGDVQFMQDANLERYLAAAKQVANHAVIGAGPIEFFSDPGKTGFELSAISRIRDIYTEHGFRTVSGEGGRPFGLEKYSKAFYAAWRFKHRATLGEKTATLAAIAAKEGISPQFAEHVYKVVNPAPGAKPGYPVSEVISRWQKLPETGADEASVRKACEEIQKFVVTWPSWLFARGDVAAGGAGDESPLEFSDRTLNVKSPHRFIYVRGGGRIPPPAGPAKIYLNVQPANPSMAEKPLVIWRNLTVAFRPIIRRQAAKAGESVVASVEELAFAAALRKGILPPGARTPLRELLAPAMAANLKFGTAPDGSELGPNDFASEGTLMIEIPMPEGKEPMALNLQVEAEIGKDRNQVARITISDRPDGQTRGVPTRALIGDMSSAGYKAFRNGVNEYARLLPPNSHGEPTPADRDPIPEPFDNEYNTPEHDEFVQKIKYIRDDKFFAENLVDAETRARLDHAWNDLFASFDYHNLYLRMLGRHYGVDLSKEDITQMDKARIAAFPAEMQKYVRPLRAHYDAVMAAQVAGRARHVGDCVDFAARAWRRPLTESEKQSLRAFYQRTMAAEADHPKAIRALIARVLVAPQFLYRIEVASNEAPARAMPAGFAPETPGVKPLTNWEMASRLSFFLWASIPDAELRRAAGAGELTEPEGIRKQVKRMLADPKARRLSAEFFGQWLGFYHFDQYRGVDTGRFPEFTDAVKQAMHDEAVSFFEYIVRNDRPVGELWEADYTFLNQTLAKFYGIDRQIASADKSERVAGANAFHRGGALRLGAVLTATSAPLRTSPVKRGDWILRRIIGTPVPPPPADAGSIPADDKQFGGLSLKQKLEQHKRNATCANCHTRIDPLGFSLERFDPTGRWRDKYGDGKPIEDSATLTDKTELAGVDGLLKYLQAKDGQVRKNLSQKLIGYALGRTVLASDLALVDRMVQAGTNAPFSSLIAEIAISKQFRTRMESEAAPRGRDKAQTKID